jgi:hypothetical protein
MQLTHHAKKRMTMLAPVVGREPIQMLLHRLDRVPSRGSYALVVPLDFQANDPNRLQGSPCDHLAAVIRNGRVVSVMLSRTSQIHTEHFRVGTIIQ